MYIINLFGDHWTSKWFTQMTQRDWHSHILQTRFVYVLSGVKPYTLSMETHNISSFKYSMVSISFVVSLSNYVSKINVRLYKLNNCVTSKRLKILDSIMVSIKKGVGGLIWLGLAPLLDDVRKSAEYPYRVALIPHMCHIILVECGPEDLQKQYPQLCDQ